jgi:hypothetical protein
MRLSGFPKIRPAKFFQIFGLACSSLDNNAGDKIVNIPSTPLLLIYVSGP